MFITDDMVIEKDVVPERPAIRQAWAWVQPRLDADQTLSRQAFTPADLKPLMDHASLFHGRFEGDRLVDYKVMVMARILADTIGEFSGKLASQALPRDYFERWLHAGRFATDHARPFLTRSSVIGKEYRRSEHLIVPIRVGGRIGQLLMFSDIWFEGD